MGSLIIIYIGTHGAGTGRPDFWVPDVSWWGRGNSWDLGVGGTDSWVSHNAQAGDPDSCLRGAISSDPWGFGKDVVASGASWVWKGERFLACIPGS